MTEHRRLDDDVDPAEAWPHVVRVAGVAAVLAALGGVVLNHFVGIGALPVLVASAAIALIVGLHLPPAAPAFLQPFDPLDTEAEQFFDDVL